jgi:hypothetical protein
MKRVVLGLVCGLIFGVTGEASAGEFTCPQEEGTFAHPRDGKKFLECIRGIPTEKACMSGLMWDDLRKGCASPKSVRHKPPRKPPAKKKRGR